MFLSNSLILDWIILSTIVILLYYLKTIFVSYQYWKSRNVPFLRPTFPFGNFYEVTAMRRPPHIVFHDIYMEIKFGLKSPFAGIYTMTTPVLVLTESEIIKHVLIKDFDVFTDRGFFESDEPVLKILFGLTGDEWRKMRNKLSPTFTSGKIKEMFPLMETCGRNLETILTTLDYNKKHQSIDVKEYLGRYMTDVIGSTVFGLEINSLENPDCEFRRISKEMFTENNNMRLQIILALILLIPYLRKFMSYMMLLRKAAYFFLDVVHQNVSYREQNNIKRNDFINIMMELKKTDPGNYLENKPIVENGEGKQRIEDK
ncbi:cytochrome P450 6k1-like [Diaphorina citri]|uniref:Cytochrome P450 6k1-like n=1 Tax=Diaphorina citri TaxID=121845 RepID=A0A1S3DH86_DIACI|nr:cytochrome P450 6k1-like [Diaphorina citri]